MGLPPVRNWPLLFLARSLAHLSFTLLTSNGRKNLVNSREFSSSADIDMISSPPSLCSAPHVEPAWIRHSRCSSTSQVETESAPNVSEISRDAVELSAASSRAAGRVRANRTQI